MKIIYKSGDALKGPEAVFIHGCNAKGVMGSGIAVQVKRDHPEAFKVYRDLFQTFGLLQLGAIIPVSSNGKLIINAITQATYGADGKRYASYDALVDCFQRVDALMKSGEYGEMPEVAMPKIAAERGGCSWPIIEAIIEDNAENYQPVVYLYP